MLAVAGNAQQSGSNQDSGTSTTSTVDMRWYIYGGIGLALLLLIALVAVGILLKNKRSMEDTLDKVVAYQVEAAKAEPATVPVDSDDSDDGGSLASV